MKFSEEKAIIYYCHEESYWVIINYKFIENKRNLFLGLELAKRSILQEKSLAYLNLDLEID